MATPKKEKTNLPAVKNGNDLIESKNTNSAMAVHANFDKSMFDGVQLDVQENKELFSNDILMPKLWLIQDMSELRKSGEAKVGEYRQSISKELVSVAGEELPIIVLSMFKRWHTFTVDAKGNQEFLSSEIMVFGKNHDYKYEDVLEGKNIVRKQVISCYALLVSDVQKGLNNPFVIDFASTSKGAGRALVTDIATINKAGYPSWVAWFNLGAKEESFAKGDAYVKTMGFGGYLNGSNQALMAHLKDCYDNIVMIKDQIVIDDADIGKEQSPEELDLKAANKKADKAASGKI